MTRKQNQLIIKTVEAEDWEDVVHLIHSQSNVHRHLGWRSPLDWLGRDPYLGAFQGEELMGVLACPPDEDGITWMRLLAIKPGQDPVEIWENLWLAAEGRLLERQDVGEVNALAMQSWLIDLLRGSGFQHTYDVIVLEWEAERAAFPAQIEGVQIRKMDKGDLETVYEIDQASFDPLWRNSLQSLRVALKVANLASVAVVDGDRVGYQISTADTLGGHLARLAVRPDFQGRGVGTALVAHVLRRFERMGLVRASVNTQEDNLASIKLYEKFGFYRKDESYPVYQYFFGD